MSVLFFVDLYRSRLGYLRTGRMVSLVSIFVRVSDNFRSNNYTCTTHPPRSRINRLDNALNEEEALRHPNRSAEVDKFTWGTIVAYRLPEGWCLPADRREPPTSPDLSVPFFT